MRALAHGGAFPILLLASFLATHPAFPVRAQEASQDAVTTDGMGAGGVRARVVPEREAILSSDIQGRITGTPVRPGQSFKAGQLLMQLDCSELEARRQGAEALLSSSRRIEEAKRKLAQLGSVSELEVALAEADAAKAQAEATLYRVQASRCSIKAPFAGRVVERYVQSAETVVAGQKLLAIIDDGSLQAEVLVPSSWLRWLKPGQNFKIQVDETGQIYDLQVRDIGARVDSVSQSIPVYGLFVTPPEGLLAGMSGVAVFEQNGNDGLIR